MLHTGNDLLTDKQHLRFQHLFGGDEHVEVGATWAVYQATIAAYREPDRTRGRQLMRRLIDSISHNVPAALSEVVTLGRTLMQRAGDILLGGKCPAQALVTHDDANGAPSLSTHPSNVRF